jgi:hypothetical protein
MRLLLNVLPVLLVEPGRVSWPRHPYAGLQMDCGFPSKLTVDVIRFEESHLSSTLGLSWRRAKGAFAERDEHVPLPHNLQLSVETCICLFASGI